MTAPAVGPDGPLYLTTDEVAARFRTNAATVRTWRHRGTGPVGTRFGKRVLYSADAIAEWERRIHAAEHGPALSAVPSHRNH